MRPMRAPKRLRGSLRQTQIAYFAIPDELAHRADGLLNRYFEIDAVLVVQIDHIDAETPQAGIARLLHVLRPAAYAQELAVFRADIAEFSREHDLIATSTDSATHYSSL